MILYRHTFLCNTASCVTGSREPRSPTTERQRERERERERERKGEIERDTGARAGKGEIERG